MGFLKNHPFAVEAYFENSTVLTFAIPKGQLETLIPDCLELDTFQDEWAFVAIAMVQTKGLRPKGFPRIFGNDFFLIGYRIFVRYTNKAGKRLRGLYILKSQTDKLRMQFLGNIFTHYKYSTIDVNRGIKQNVKFIESKKSNFRVELVCADKLADVPNDSPFENWKEARRFAGPLPHTFNCNSKNNTVVVVQGVRQNWIPKPLDVISYRFEFLNKDVFENPVLASAFEINHIPYSWKKGYVEKWK